MATYYSNEYTSRNLPEDRPDGDLQGGVLRIKKATYNMTGSEAANDVVNLFKLPEGAEVVKTGSFVKAVGTIAVTCTVDIGDDDPTADPDRYATALDVAAAGLDAFDEEPVHTLTQESNIQLLFKTLATPGSTGVLHVYVAYRSPGQ